MFQTCTIDSDSSDSTLINNIKRRKTVLEESIKTSADFLRKTLPYKPTILVICGSELGFLTKDLEDISEISYSSIPKFPTTAGTNKGKLILGRISKVPVLFMQERLHLYEGHPLWKCTLPIRILQSLEIKVMLISNTSRAVNKLYKKGDVMIIEDHIDLARLLGNFSLRGPEENLFDFDYNPFNKIYDKKLIETGVNIGKEVLAKRRVHKGVYSFSAGPNQESGADINFLQRFGSDVVGSSSVHEAIVAKSCGMTVFGFSLIGSICGVDCVRDEDHHEEASGGADLTEFFRRIINEINVTA
ncbi:purine nucleoside phosphorylase-like [Harmonia axyridis]|uniref:purine nucleoside phosphorylase-like n=1 Tax=Harmonia axyridis TaxID=115357 RepID=UPI001E277DA0|nr:purine nucleoside phosphorylase-like [Harmonia axyridis]